MLQKIIHFCLCLALGVGASEPAVSRSIVFPQSISPDPHWRCSGGDQCREWVQGVLDALKTAGEPGYGVWTAFQAYAASVARTGGQVHIFLARGGGAQGSALALPYAPSLTLYEGYWRRRPSDAHVVGVFAHEVTHLLQGYAISWSIQGELAAYEVQYRVLAALGDEQLPQYSFLGDLHQFHVTHGDVARLTDAEIEAARQLMVRWVGKRSGYSFEPGRPFWVMTGFYRALYGSAALDAALNPHRLYEALAAYQPHGRGRARAPVAAHEEHENS
jgi:hypothetical protein